MTAASTRKLTLDDIADLRAYERERAEFRAHIIGLKKVRRVSVGPHVTLVFENRETIRFQIQEMARAEKILSDEGIQVELDIYNDVIPEPGHAVGDVVHRADRRRPAARVAAQVGGHRALHPGALRWDRGAVSARGRPRGPVDP